MKIGNLLERNSVIQYYNVATVYGLDDPSLFFMIVLFLALHESVETNQNQSHEKWLHPTKNKANIPHSSTKSQTQKI